jgi:hypothetical protein
MLSRKFDHRGPHPLFWTVIMHRERNTFARDVLTVPVQIFTEGPGFRRAYEQSEKSSWKQTHRTAKTAIEEKGDA